MKKLTLLFLIIIDLGVIFMSGCESKEEKEKEFDYSLLYKTTYTEAFRELEYKTNKYIYGSVMNTKQGYNSWYYLANDLNNPKEMVYDDGSFKYLNSEINQDIMKVKENGLTIRRFVANIEGNADIYGFVKAQSSQSDFTAKIYLNGEVIWEKEIAKNDEIGYYYEINKNIKKEDKIDFVITGNNATASFESVVSLDKSMNSSLYHLNDFNKQYGDVFPWYNEDENKLYLWYLWSDDCYKGYEYTIDVSTNLVKMKSYNEANNYDLYDKMYHNYFYSQVFNTNNYIETNKYSFGIRDNFMSYDKENNRYLLIAGCYYAFTTTYPFDWRSDLVIYSSNDNVCLDWNYNGNVIASYDGNLPECPSILKIGNRWYPFVSVSHVTTHQIGALQYWVGEENVDCLDNDYSKSSIYFLDGEDLCAARPTYVLNKVYMWGWITSNPDGVPLSPWAGYLNLPREIVQRSDGTLGGRIDPGLVEKLNYGNIIKKDELFLETDNIINIGYNLNRNFITYTLNMKNCDSSSIVFTQDNKRYTCSIEKENDKVYMRIRSLDDSTHPINSTLEIYNPSDDDIYNVKIVIDSGIIEFFVNEDNSLTGSTKMTSDNYTIGFKGNGSMFTNIMINKLRSYEDFD